MTRSERLTKSVTDMINTVQADVMQVRNMPADQLIAGCGVRAQLAIAAALPDVADAIRSARAHGRGQE
jgi:hypothetical protein